MKFSSNPALFLVCLFILLLEKVSSTFTENNSEQEQDFCPICLFAYKSANLTDENAPNQESLNQVPSNQVFEGKKIPFHLSSCPEFPLNSTELHYLCQKCFVQLEKSASDKKTPSCPLCRQPREIDTPKIRLSLYCEAKDVDKNIEKNISFIVSKVSNKDLKNCVEKCLSKSYWDRFYNIYLGTNADEKQVILIDALKETIPTTSLNTILELFYSSKYNFIKLFKKHFQFKPVFSILLRKFVMSLESHSSDGKPLSENAILSLTMKDYQFKEDLWKYFCEMESNDNKTNLQERLISILLDLTVKNFIDLQRQNSNQTNMHVKAKDLSSILSVLLCCERILRFQLDDSEKERLLQHKAQALNLISQIENSYDFEMEEFYPFYEFRAYLEILNSQELYEKMQSLKGYDEIPSHSLPIVAYYVEDEFLHLFKNTESFSRLEFEELKKISTKMWYRYLFRQIIDYFSRFSKPILDGGNKKSSNSWFAYFFGRFYDFFFPNSQIKPKGPINNFAIDGKICEISLVKSLLQMLKKNMSFSSLENLSFSRIALDSKWKYSLQLIEKGSIHGGLKNLSLDDVSLAPLDLNLLMQVLRKSSTTLISIEMNYQLIKGGSHQASSSKPVKLENVKNINIFAGQEAFCESIYFKCHSNYESISLNGCYLNFSKQDGQEYFTLKSIKNDQDLEKIREFLGPNKKLVKLHLPQLFNFQGEIQKNEVNQVLKSLSNLKSFCLDRVENFGNYNLDKLPLENLEIYRFHDHFDQNWQSLEQLSKLKTLTIASDFELNDSFLSFIANSQVENLTFPVGLCGNVEKMLKKSPILPERTIYIYGFQSSTNIKNSKLFAVLNAKGNDDEDK